MHTHAPVSVPVYMNMENTALSYRNVQSIGNFGSIGGVILIYLCKLYNRIAKRK